MSAFRPLRDLIDAAYDDGPVTQPVAHPDQWISPLSNVHEWPPASPTVSTYRWKSHHTPLWQMVVEEKGETVDFASVADCLIGAFATLALTLTPCCDWKAPIASTIASFHTHSSFSSTDDYRGCWRMRRSSILSSSAFARTSRRSMLSTACSTTRQVKSVQVKFP